MNRQARKRQASYVQLAPHELAASIRGRTAIFIGATGAGKSTLVASVADHLPPDARAMCADPGSPAFGAPTTISMAHRREALWRVDDFEAIGSLDAGKYRLSILGAASRLLAGTSPHTLLIDSPGLYRGGIAREFLTQLAAVTGADLAVYLVDDIENAELLPAARSAGLDVWLVEPSASASRPSKSARRRARTSAWDAFIDGARVHTLQLDELAVVADLPVEVGSLVGRVVGLGSDDGRIANAGEVVAAADNRLEVRAHLEESDRVQSLLIRDAGRGPEGLLRTVRARDNDEAGIVEVDRRTPFTLRDRTSAPSLDAPQTLRVGMFEVSLLGGPFDDPSAYISLLHHERGMLVDFGESWRLPTRLHHQLTDVFLTHAHVDHFAGFVDVLRRRVHVRDACRVWGPRGTARRVEAMIDAFTWDRLEEHGPVFEVCEFHGDEIQRFRVEAGISALEAIGVEPSDGRLLDEPRFRVHATVLDHGTDSLAFRFEETQHFDVRSDRLGPPFDPGPWLGELKRLAAMGDEDRVLTMSDESSHTVGELRSRLLLERPGQSLVYASDLADSAENRRRLTDLARGVDLLVCEAYFAERDREKAALARHLTTTACAEIAEEAGVGKLLPFHFSARYGDEPHLIYDELRSHFDDVVIPRQLRAEIDD
ncbi:MAG: MBL fold metallo-hydrolase [Myxococcota bacterium]